LLRGDDFDALWRGTVSGFALLRLDLLLHTFNGFQDAVERSRRFEALAQSLQLRQYRRLIGRQLDRDRTDLCTENDA
jgi:hypothetical protein